MEIAKTICTVCNYIYDEALGEPRQELPPSIRFDNLPDDWSCPECNSPKDMFQPCSCVSLSLYEATRATVSSEQAEAIANQPVGQLVAQHPLWACTFEQFAIDYCCGGKQTLTDVCKAKNLAVGDVIARLEGVAVESTKRGKESDPDLTKATLKEVIDHILAVYHAPLRNELPRLLQLASKVALVHGRNHPEMIELRDVFQTFKQELELHMQKEELILFPAIVSMEAGGASKSFGCGGSIEHPIEVMTKEHDDAGAALAKLRDLTNGFAPPEDACSTYKLLLYSLAEFEITMHQHVHKENNILFPRASEIAQRAEAACKAAV